MVYYEYIGGCQGYSVVFCGNNKVMLGELYGILGVHRVMLGVLYGIFGVHMVILGVL